MTKLQDVNTRDIHDALELGCRAMSNAFNADDGEIPYGGASVRPLAALGGSSEAHSPGRHLKRDAQRRGRGGNTAGRGRGGEARPRGLLFLQRRAATASPRQAGRPPHSPDGPQRTRGVPRPLRAGEVPRLGTGTAAGGVQHSSDIRVLGPGRRVGQRPPEPRLRPQPARAGVFLVRQSDCPLHRAAREALPGDRVRARPGFGAPTQGQGPRRSVPGRRRLRRGALRRPLPFDDLRHVLAGAACRPDGRRVADGPGQSLLRQRPLGDSRRDRMEHRGQRRRGGLGPRRGQQHRRHPGDRAPPRPVGPHRVLPRRREDTALPPAAVSATRRLLRRGAPEPGRRRRQAKRGRAGCEAASDSPRRTATSRSASWSPPSRGSASTWT